MGDNDIKIVNGLNRKKVVLINKTLFKGKRIIKGKIIKDYLKRYINNFYKIVETGDIVYIGKDLPDEYAHSKYTYSLRRSMAKVKANSIVAIPKIIEIAANKNFVKNIKEKHNKDAKFGWYRYETRFAFPLIDNDKNIVSYKVYKAYLLVKASDDGKLYLYDMIDIKKETGSPL